MAQIDKVRIIQRRLISDDRGWFLKVITGTEEGIPSHTGEVYLTMGKPGQERGGHYHPEAVEWFTIIDGSAVLKLEDLETHERKDIEMSFEKAITVFIPNNVVHMVVNNGDKDFILLAYTDKLYDPKDTIVHLNPTGRYVNHGPLHDSGLTGRKLIVDSFGGYSPIGGGAQSSKDYTKVDRSGLYAARYIAKHIVAFGLAKKACIQISYAIGVAKPISVSVDTYGTTINNINDDILSDFVMQNFPLTPNWITKKFALDTPSKETFLYADVAARGQVGQSDYPWEKLDNLDIFENIK